MGGDSSPVAKEKAADEFSDLHAGQVGFESWFPQQKCWFDAKRRLVLVDAYVCQRQAMLEMFACPSGTKDHESIVAVHCKAATIHAYLLAVGAVNGKPVPVRS